MLEAVAKAFARVLDAYGQLSPMRAFSVGLVAIVLVGTLSIPTIQRFYEWSKDVRQYTEVAQELKATRAQLELTKQVLTAEKRESERLERELKDAKTAQKKVDGSANKNEVIAADRNGKRIPWTDKIEPYAKGQVIFEGKVITCSTGEYMGNVTVTGYEFFRCP